MMGFAAVLGSTVFFIVHGFRKNAEVQEARMMGSGMSDVCDCSPDFNRGHPGFFSPEIAAPIS